MAAVALVFAVVWVGHKPPDYISDFEPVYIAARAVWRGQDPYTAVVNALQPGRLEHPLFYPATAPVLVAPLGALPFRLAISLFTALGMGMLAWSLGKCERWRLWILVSAPALHTVALGQWSTWMTAAVGLPWLGLVWAAKPSTGLPLLIGWPSRAALIGGAALTVVSLVLYPHWPASWLAALSNTPQYLAPVQRPFGMVLLLAFLRWRQPEARMLGTLALVPHTTVLNEMLAPLLVARTRRQLGGLIALGYVAAYLTYTRMLVGRDVPRILAAQWPFMLTLVYIPALVVVLWKPSCTEQVRPQDKVAAT
jgi:hypothetical protein